MHIGLSELLLTGLIAVLVIHPRQWPAIMHQLGKGIGRCKQLYTQLQAQCYHALNEPPKKHRDKS